MNATPSLSGDGPTRLRRLGPHAGSDHDVDDAPGVLAREHAAPDGGYGWVCTLSVFMINAHTWGINSSWGIILAYCLARETFPGATHLQFAFIGGLSISQALMVGPVATAMQNRWGLKPALLFGTLLMFVALFTSAYATRIWHLFLSQGVCFGWGMGFLYTPASSALPSWFSSRRSLAVGLSTSGAGFGGLVYSLATNAAIEAWGLPWTYRVLALCSFSANLLATALLRDLATRSLSPTPARLFRLRDMGRLQVLLVVAWGVTTELGYITLLYSLPHYATTIGLSTQQGSMANALLNVGLGLGRPLIGYASDFLGRINTALIMTATCAVFCFALWIPADGFPLLATFAVLAGGLCGIFWATVTPILVEIVGLGQLSGTFGFVCTLMVLPTTFAEPIAMSLVGGSGNVYLTAQIFVGIAFVVGATSLCLLRAWKILGTRPPTVLAAEAPWTSRPRPGLGDHWPWLRAFFSLDRV